MSDIPSWSDTAGGNDAAVPDGWPEGQDKATVNNCARELMAAIRRWYDATEWLDFTNGRSGFTKNNDTQVQIDGVTIASYFSTHRRIKITAVAGDVEGFVTSASDVGSDTVINVSLDGADVVPATPTGVYAFIAPDARQAAFRELGLATEKLVLWDDFGDAAFEDQGSENGLDADTVDTKHWSDILAEITDVRRNLVVNGGFRIWQRATSFSGPDDDTLIADCWKVRAEQDGASDVALETSDVPSGARSALKLTSAIINKKFGVLTFIEAGQLEPLLGGDPAFISLSFQAKTNSLSANAITDVRAAVIEWTGTEDTVGDPISAWPLEGNDPTWAGSIVEAAADSFALTTSWQEFVIEGIELSAAAKNIGILIWTDEDDITTTRQLLLGNVCLKAGAAASSYSPRTWQEELQLCQRQLAKTFKHGDAIQQNIGNRDGALHAVAAASSTRQLGATWFYPVTMVKVPSVTGYNPNAADAKWRWISGSGDAVAIIEGLGDSACAVFGDTGLGSYRDYAIHLAAEASIF